MPALDITGLVADLPAVRMALVVAGGLRIDAERSPKVEALVAAVEAEVSAAVVSTPIAAMPEIRCWREAYKAFGVKKTNYRSSVERLLKNVERRAGLLRVNTLVDLYDAVSARYLMPVGADDLDRVAPPLSFRYARPGDSFVALGHPDRTPDPPKPGEVVYANAEKCLCRRWNWHQDARSAMVPSTTRAVLTVQALAPASAGRLEAAAVELCALLRAHCNARTARAVADRSAPNVSVAAP